MIKTLTPTTKFRWLRVTDTIEHVNLSSSSVLQQAYTSNTGATEWIDVPTTVITKQEYEDDNNIQK